jgi:hypothetical protein
MNPVSLQWALNETAGVTISVSKGLIKAASSDNIQALALIVCEAFGATLAMCQETCMKVERISGMRHESRTVKFLKSQNWVFFRRFRCSVVVEWSWRAFPWTGGRLKHSWNLSGRSCTGIYDRRLGRKSPVPSNSPSVE